MALDLAGDGPPPELAWRNDLGGLTFRLADRYLKWNPPSTGIDLDRERVRLEWLAPRHPAPRVLDHGVDEDGAQWLLTAALPGELAVWDAWRARRPEAIQALADGLRAMHAIPVADAPSWITDSWVCRMPENLGARPPLLDAPVLVHGDACAPNTLISAEGRWTGNVDFGDLSVGDRWADLAVASLIAPSASPGAPAPQSASGSRLRVRSRWIRQVPSGCRSQVSAKVPRSLSVVPASGPSTGT